MGEAKHFSFSFSRKGFEKGWRRKKKEANDGENVANTGQKRKWQGWKRWYFAVGESCARREREEHSRRLTRGYPRPTFFFPPPMSVSLFVCGSLSSLPFSLSFAFARSTLSTLSLIALMKFRHGWIPRSTRDEFLSRGEKKIGALATANWNPVDRIFLCVR